MKRKKLSLRTETIRVLTPTQLGKAAGGLTWTCLGTDCTCMPTYAGTACDPTHGYTRCICTTDTMGSVIGC